MGTYHRAVATNDKVLPTYIGSRRTLKGNLGIQIKKAKSDNKNAELYPSTLWSIRMPK